MAEMAAAAWAFVKAAFVAVGSGTATAGQVATVVAVNVAGSVALSAAASVLMKPDVGGRAPGEWLADPNAGIPFAIGDRIGVAGNIVYKNTFGKDNEYKGIVTVLSGAGPISAYLGFTADREPIAFAGEAATGRYGGEMWMQRRLGEQPDTALTSPAAITYQTLPNWGPNHRLSGKAAFMWTLRMDSKFSVYPQGEPAPITVLRGIKGYDHRYDSTMPGGSGPCRLNDRSTYRTITNPAIADLNWCLGLRENGKVVGGLGVSPAGIDWSAYTRAANVADANDWTIAAYPRSDESKSEVRAGMLQAGGAVISRRAGLVSCVTRGAPKSPVMTISAADTAGPIELDTAANVLNRYSTITPRYLSEAHEWLLTAAEPVTSSVYIEEDRGRVRSDQRDYPYVPSAKQAAELCALDIAHSREGIAGRWPLKAYCRELEPGDVFTVNEPGLLLDGMDMLVLDRDYDPETDTPYVVFVSETPGKVAWALGQQANPSPTPALSARHDLNAPDPGAFDVVIVPPSPEGVSAPGAEVVIDIDNARAEDIVIEIGPSFDGPWRVAKTVTINDGQLRIPVNELSPGEVFWVALSYRSADDGASPKTIKGPYTAGDLIAGGLAPDAAEKVVQEVLDQVGDIAAGTEAAEQVAELVLETILNENDALVKEAKERGEGIAIAYQGAVQHADNKIAEVTYTMATIAMLNDAQAATLFQAHSYTDGSVATAMNTVYTKAEVDAGRATTLQQAKSYSDAKATEASLLYATKAERENGDAATYASMKSYVDAYKAEANLTFATTSQLNGVSATAALALSTAQSADGKLNEARVRLVAAAGGGNPALVELFSGGAGSFVRLAAAQILFGDNTVFEDATDTLVTTTGSVRYITAWGAPFGPDALTYWVGPSNVSTSSATKAAAEAAGGQWRDAAGDSFFGGKTLSGPFDTGTSGASPVFLNEDWTTIASTSLHPMRDGAFSIKVTMEAQADAQNSQGPQIPSIVYRVVSVDASGGDVVVLHQNSVTAPSSWGTMNIGYLSPALGQRRGRRRLLLQVLIGSPTYFAQVRHVRMNGLYTADVTSV
ncbi:hypothetical protein [Brevundimonas sp.]|uniref:hypothetical protein n=1 Tax=Brevundimonas sp. TaxID=1871086 RepID=UPI0028AE405F|nr:hypothetical protein [Brevundimonas sp.]